MANWVHHDWRSEAGDAARLAKLKLHLAEVTLRIAEKVNSEGQGVDSKNVLEYYESLKEEARELQERVDATSGTRGGGMVAFRVRI